MKNECKYGWTLSWVLTRKLCKSLSSVVDFSTYGILKIIRSLNPNKVHGHDMISICDKSTRKPLGIIFRSCYEKANVVPLFKKTPEKQEQKSQQKQKQNKTINKRRAIELWPHVFTACKSFENFHSVWFVFLDMSKAFDKAWHKGLIFKLKQNRISGNLLSTLTDFLKLKKQRVVVNGVLKFTSFEL